MFTRFENTIRNNRIFVFGISNCGNPRFFENVDQDEAHALRNTQNKINFEKEIRQRDDWISENQNFLGELFAFCSYFGNWKFSGIMFNLGKRRISRESFLVCTVLYFQLERRQSVSLCVKLMSSLKIIKYFGTLGFFRLGKLFWNASVSFTRQSSKNYSLWVYLQIIWNREFFF